MAIRLSGANANVEQYSSIVKEGLSSAAEEAGKGNAAKKKSAPASTVAAGAATSPRKSAAIAAQMLSLTVAGPFRREDRCRIDFRMLRVRRADFRIHLPD